MQRIWVTADHHFGHLGILGKGRPFSSLEEMETALIARHNARVGPRDDVFFLGDFSGSKDRNYLLSLFNRMKGRKHLLIGNHDTNAVKQLPWATPAREQYVLKSEGRQYVLAHHFRASWDNMYRDAFHLYGHTHGKLVASGKSIDVGVDAWGYEPITLQEAVYAMRKYNKDYNTYIPEQEAIQRFRIHEDDIGIIRNDGLDGRDFLNENIRLELEIAELKRQQRELERQQEEMKAELERYAAQPGI